MYTNTLERQNEKLSRFAATTAHDLKGPMRRIAALTQKLIGELNGSGTERTECLANLLQKEVEHAGQVINNCVENINGKNESSGVIDIKAIIYDITGAFMNHYDDVVFETQREYRTVNGNPIELYRILHNLVSNAVNHNDKEIKIVKIYEEVNSLVVEDNGPGIPEDVINHLGNFKKHGIGLYNVLELAKKNDWLTLVETSSQGTIFKLQFK